jgi:hypothetical protein
LRGDVGSRGVGSGTLVAVADAGDRPLLSTPEYRWLSSNLAMVTLSFRCSIRIPVARVRAVLAVALLLADGRRARAAAPMLDGEIRALALAGDRVVAVRRADVWVVSTAGRVLGKLGPAGGVAGTATKGPAVTPRRRPSAEDLVDRLGIVDDDPAIDPVRGAFEDEGPHTGRRRRDPLSPPEGVPTAAAPMLTVLGASRDAIWIAGEAGLRRLDTSGGGGVAAATISIGSGVAIGPRHLALSALSVAPDGQRLAALAGHQVLRSTDGGRSWSLLAVTPTRPHAVVLPDEGDEVYVLDEEGIAIVAHQQRFPVFQGAVREIAWCGDELLLAGADGVFAWRWDVGLEPRGARLPARRLLCSPAVRGVAIAFGPALSISRDGGRSWMARADLATQEIQSVAIEPEQLWVGGPGGLTRVPLAAPVVIAVPIVAGTAAAGAARAAVSPVGLTRAALPHFLSSPLEPWRGLLPAISLVVTRSAIRPGGDRGALFLLLAFPLGGARARSPRAAGLAADVLRRRAEATAALARLARAAPGDDESAALARLARETLEEQLP